MLICVDKKFLISSNFWVAGPAMRTLWYPIKNILPASPVRYLLGPDSKQNLTLMIHQKEGLFIWSSPMMPFPLQQDSYNNQDLFPLSCRCSGVVTGIRDLDPYRWPKSRWRCLMVYFIFTIHMYYCFIWFLVLVFVSFLHVKWTTTFSSCMVWLSPFTFSSSS